MQPYSRHGLIALLVNFGALPAHSQGASAVSYRRQGWWSVARAHRERPCASRPNHLCRGRSGGLSRGGCGECRSFEDL